MSDHIVTETGKEIVSDTSKICSWRKYGMSEYSLPLLFHFFTVWFILNEIHLSNRFIFPFYFSSFESWNFSTHQTAESSSRHLFLFYCFSLSDIQKRNWEHSSNTVSLLQWVSSMSQVLIVQSLTREKFHRKSYLNPRASLSIPLFQFFSFNSSLFLFLSIFLGENLQWKC